jgi:hypothetical protein
MAFYYFTWQDSGAPTLTGQNGSLTNSGNTGVLDWVLVTKGGWTKSQTATNGSVFTPVTGNAVLMVIHDSATSGSATGATVRGAESASGVATASLTNPFPTLALVTDANSNWTASSTADATQRPYAGIVTDSALYLWTGRGYSTANYNTTVTAGNHHFFGQFAKAISSDSYNTCVSVANTALPNSNSAFVNSTSGGPAANSRFFADRTADGIVFSPAVTLVVPTGTAVAVGNPSPTILPAYPNGLDNKLHLCKLPIADGYSTTGGGGAKAIQTRGWLPNIWAPMEGIGTLINYKTFVDSAYNGAALFQYLADSVGSTRVALETTNTWSAPGI